MTLRKSATRPKERWALLAVLVAGLLLLAGAIALAVNATGAFELDGNAVSASGASGAAPDDWDRVCHEAGGASCSTTDNTHGATAVSWVDSTSSLEIYTGGGSKDFKDPQDDWLWKPKDTVPDKDTILHSFAARYSLTPNATTCPSSDPTCEVIFFGSDRYDNSGDSQLGFWFFQNKVETTDTPSQGGFEFSGHHKIGDLLVISDFSNGGVTSTIKVYSWQPTECTKADSGPEDNIPVGGCPAKNLRLEGKSDAANCDTTQPADPFCGIVNATDGTTAPWPYTDKSGNSSYLQGEFYEAGLNVSALGFGSECFASVLAESRASDSTGSVLKDFVLSNFGECTSSTVTTPQTYDSGTGMGSDISSDLSIGASARVDVRDKADISVTGLGGSFDGSVKFYLCGPLALDSTSNCATGGVQIGSPAAGETVNGSGGTATVYSDPATLTSAGRYCWRAEYGGDTATGVPASSDPTSPTDTSTSECFKVNPLTPTLSTTAVDAEGKALTGAVDFGQALYDKASLTGTAKQPGDDGKPGGTGTIDASAGSQDPAGGTIVFKLYGPSTTATPTPTECAALPLAKDKDDTSFPSTGISVTVIGDSTSAGYPATNPSTVTFTPGAPGYYFWKAAYGGDSPNTTAAPLDASGNPTQHNVNCDVAAERVQVRTIPTDIRTNQSWYPNDTVQIKSSVSGDDILPGGTVEFYLYDDATCTGNLKYSEKITLVAGDITSGVATVSTHNYVGGGGTAPSGTWAPFEIATTLLDSANTTVNYSWQVIYQPAASDTAHVGRQSSCSTDPVSIEKFSITYTNDNSGGTTYP